MPTHAVYRTPTLIFCTKPYTYIPYQVFFTSRRNLLASNFFYNITRARYFDQTRSIYESASTVKGNTDL